MVIFHSYVSHYQRVGGNTTRMWRSDPQISPRDPQPGSLGSHGYSQASHIHHHVQDGNGNSHHRMEWIRPAGVSCWTSWGWLKITPRGPGLLGHFMISFWEYHHPVNWESRYRPVNCLKFHHVSPSLGLQSWSSAIFKRPKRWKSRSLWRRCLLKSLPVDTGMPWLCPSNMALLVYTIYIHNHIMCMHFICIYIYVIYIDMLPVSIYICHIIYIYIL